jgi:Leucine-rich repeat (LRR) protein
MNRDALGELHVKDQGITRIGNLVDTAGIRILDISYNPITSLNGIDQLPQLRQMTAYGCRIRDIEALNGYPQFTVLYCVLCIQIVWAEPRKSKS